MYGGLFPATLLVGAMVALMVLLWAGFMLWGLRSGQFRGADEMRRRPLEDDMPPEKEGGWR